MATRISLADPTDPTICAYCQQAYTPTRRWVQKYCGSACRVAASNARTGRAHPLESKKVRARRRAKSLGRTPSAVKTGKGGLSFQETVLAAGVGSLGANTLTQTAEYLLITKQLLAEVQHLRQAVVHLTARQRKMDIGQGQDNQVLAQGLYKVMRTLGLSSSEAEQALRLPVATPQLVPPAANAIPTTPMAHTRIKSTAKEPQLPLAEAQGEG